MSVLSRLDDVLRPGGHIFYGWWIVSSAAGIQMLSSMLWMQSFGAYVVLLQEDFGWSKAVIAGAFALTRVESGILGPLQGWLVDRYGPRIILMIGLAMFGVGFMMFSQITSLLGFYLTFALIAVGSSLGGFATVMVSIVNWFSRNRAKAVAVSQLGHSIGGLSVPIVILSLEAFGWRTTAFASGVAVLVIGLPLVQLVRHRPETHGEVADGISLPVQTAPGAKAFAEGRDFTAREAIRTRAFWLISIGHAFSLLTVSAVMVFMVPHLTEGLGFSLGEAGYVVALMTACQMGGQMAGGFLGDRFNKRYICAVCLVSHTAGLLMIAYATGLSMVVAFAVLHGFAWGTRGPLMVALRADYFGPSSFGTIMGFSSLIVMFGMTGGPLIAGFMADQSGTYVSGLATLACLTFLGSFCFLAAKAPEKRFAVV
jgi:sugar phosphate permease